MRRLTIKNVGPIKSVTIDLKRINVLIGPQSSGKSTINKIACHCSWVEKEIFINELSEPDYSRDHFSQRLLSFHKLEEFFNEKSLITYETNQVSFSFNGVKGHFSFEWKTQDYWWNYKRTKTIYIPTERNIIAVIPNWFEIKFEDTNLRSFMTDWHEARLFYKHTSIFLFDENISYKYNSDNRQDELTLLKTKKKINLKNASSGLQSLIPLSLLLEYISYSLYQVSTKSSVQSTITNTYISNSILYKIEQSNTTLNDIYNTLKTDIDKSKDRIKSSSLKLNTDNKQQQSTFDYVLDNLENIQQSNIFLEEPEVNLFPITQRELVKYLIQRTYHNTEGREHSLFLTTHSPYILTTLNNLIYANDCAKVNKDEVSKILGEEYWVDFNDVGVWFVKDGGIEDILDSELRQIDAIRIDEVSQLLNEEFDNLLNTQYHEV